MEFLRKIGGSLKSHWEKALVAVALLALIGAVVMLNNKKEEEQNKLEAYKQNITKRKVKGIPPVDVAALNQALAPCD
jgi:HAMP domain-containing protein